MVSYGQRQHLESLLGRGVGRRSKAGRRVGCQLRWRAAGVDTGWTQGWCGHRCLAGEVAPVWCCDANWEVSGIPVGSAGVAGTCWRREGDPSVDPSAGGGPVGGPGRLHPSAGAGTRAVETGGGLGVVAFVAIKLSS